MGLATYDELKASIEDYLIRDDLVAQIPDFITLAEARHKREIRTVDMIQRSQAHLHKGKRFIQLPEGFLHMRTLRINADPVQTLQSISPSQMSVLLSNRREGTFRDPQYYCVHEELEFNSEPPEDLTLEMIFYGWYPSLSSITKTNKLLQKSPDAYLYAALLASAPWLEDDQRIQVWTQLYETAVNGIKYTDQRRRHGDPIVARVYGGTP